MSAFNQTEKDDKCPTALYKFKQHKCQFCSYRSIYKHVKDIHEYRKHIRGPLSTKNKPPLNNSQNNDNIASESKAQSPSDELFVHDNNDDNNSHQENISKKNNNIESLRDDWSSDVEGEEEERTKIDKQLKLNNNENLKKSFNPFLEPLSFDKSFDLRFVQNPKISVIG